MYLLPQLATVITIGVSFRVKTIEATQPELRARIYIRTAKLGGVHTWAKERRLIAQMPSGLMVDF
jgi:hypothetical protein